MTMLISLTGKKNVQMHLCPQGLFFQLQGQNFKIACLEEIALNNGWLDGSHIEELARTKYTKTAYGSYLMDMLKETA